MLFKPWFKEDDLLNNQDNNEAAFKFEIDNKTIDTNLVCQFENQKQKIEDAIEYTHRLQQLISSSENDYNEDDLNETNNEPYLQNHLLSEMANIYTNEESNKLKISQLNKQQKIFFDKIVNQIEHQNLH
jgi:hypothetical protein